jgi:molecular chaperone DnaK
VTAKDKETGKDQKIIITSAWGLSDEEIEKFSKEAGAHAQEDKKRKEAVEERNQLDNFIYQTEKHLKDLRGNLGDEKENLSKMTLRKQRKLLKTIMQRWMN